VTRSRSIRISSVAILLLLLLSFGPYALAWSITRRAPIGFDDKSRGIVLAAKPFGSNHKVGSEPRPGGSTVRHPRSGQLRQCHTEPLAVRPGRCGAITHQHKQVMGDKPESVNERPASGAEVLSEGRLPTLSVRVVAVLFGILRVNRSETPCSVLGGPLWYVRPEQPGRRIADRCQFTPTVRLQPREDSGGAAVLDLFPHLRVCHRKYQSRLRSPLLPTGARCSHRYPSRIPARTIARASDAVEDCEVHGAILSDRPPSHILVVFHPPGGFGRADQRFPETAKLHVVLRLAVQQPVKLIQRTDIARLKRAVQQKMNDSIQPCGYLASSVLDQRQCVSRFGWPSSDGRPNQCADECIPVLEPARRLDSRVGSICTNATRLAARGIVRHRCQLPTT